MSKCNLERVSVPKCKTRDACVPSKPQLPSSTTNGQPKNSNISGRTNNLQAARAKRKERKKERKKGNGSSAKRYSEKMRRKTILVDAMLSKP
jgi:hypothetical protein